ncbi:hypothetical protein KC330_g9246 [Hortaea werneckii]|nr:hypothetical protein KC330_g9246 [Hortaea werneckii]
MTTHDSDGGKGELIDAIKSSSVPLATSNESYAPERFLALDRVAATLDETMQRLRQRFQTIVADDMTTIRTAQETVTKSAELNLRIDNLDSAERAKLTQIESQSRRISEFERAMAAKDTALEERDSELTEKSDALTATYQQLQEMTDKCESLKQQLRKRPATPMSSNRSRAKPQSPLTMTLNMPDDDVDYEQEIEQNVQEEQDEQPGDQYAQQPDDQLSGPASSDSSTSQGGEDETPIVERDLEQLGVGLKIVAHNSEGRLAYQRCAEGLLKTILLRQLAHFRAAYGDGYVGHFSESHGDYEPDAWRCLAEEACDRFKILD